jgi:hypothetical protein
MSVHCLLAIVLAASLGRPALAQTLSVSEGAKAVAGAYEISNSDRDKVCDVTLKAEPAGANLRLELDRACTETFPALKEVTAWAFGPNDAIRLVDGRGRTVLEFVEVESGLYEGLRPGEPLYFLQSHASAGGEKTEKDMAGDWDVTRAGRTICRLTLAMEAVGADRYALKVRPGCDATITRFAPIAWHMEQGQLVVVSARGDVWRFEETDEATWRRIPETRQPLVLEKQ